MGFTFIKENGEWARKRPQVKASGIWRPNAKTFTKLGGVWRPAWTDFTPGLFGMAASTQWLRRTYPVNYNLQKFTISMWIWANGYSNAAYSPPTWPTWAAKRFWDRGGARFRMGVANSPGSGYFYLLDSGAGWSVNFYPIWGMFYPNYIQRWFHLVAQVDTTQAVAANRVKAWLNNAPFPLYSPFPSTFPPLNTAVPIITNVAPLVLAVQDNFISVHRWAFLELFANAIVPPTDVAFSWDGVWTRKPYVGVRHAADFTLAGTGGIIAQDISGNNNTFTGQNMTVGANLSTVESIMPPWIA